MIEKIVRLPLGDGSPTARLLYGQDVVASLRGLEDESVHCVVTSPPYWSQRSYLGEDDPQKSWEIGQEPTPAEFVKSMVRVFTEVHRVLRSDGVFWLNLGDTYAAERGGTAFPAETLAGGVRGVGEGDSLRGRGQDYQPHREAARIGLKHKDLVGIPHMVAFALRDAGWYYRQWCPWVKNNPMPSSCTDRPVTATECIFLFSKSSDYWYDMDAVRRPHRDNWDARASTWRKGEAKEFDREGTKYSAGEGKARPFTNAPNPLGRSQRNTDWFFDSIQSILDGRSQFLGDEEGVPLALAANPKGYPGSHFAVFPGNLVRPCILAGCPVGGTVLDPFSGSATTGAVSLREGRHYVGLDLNEAYLPLAEARILSNRAPERDVPEDSGSALDLFGDMA